MLNASFVGHDPGCSLIGISKSSILETDALAGVTVLSGVGFRSPHKALLQKPELCLSAPTAWGALQEKSVSINRQFGIYAV
jgi:hypothetical protein